MFTGQNTPRMDGSGMAFSSFVRRLCVSLSSRSRMMMYCLYLLISHGMPAHAPNSRVVHCTVDRENLHESLSQIERDVEL